jgi:hypothetical protein
MSIKDRAIELYKEGLTNKSEIARIISKETKNDNVHSIRILVIRYLKTITGESGFLDECDKQGIDPSKVSMFWHKSKRYSIKVDEKKEQFSYDNFKDDFKQFVSNIAPKHSKIKRKEISEGHCLLIDPADIHINKLCDAYETGEDYNSQIAVQRVLDGIHSTIEKSKGFNIDKIILIVGNDVLNADTTSNTTTKGTPQDVHLKWFSAFKMAKQLYIDVIDTLVKIADLEIVYNTSNHDEMSGFFLMDSICSWYKSHPNITFNESPAPRKYSVYGNNLIGTTHGDGAKTTDLPMLMVHEASEHWHNCKHRYFFSHHIHHKMSKDMMSVQIESLRSPSPADSWHNKQGYKFAPLAVEGFLFHKTHGQIARFTTLF